MRLPCIGPAALRNANLDREWALQVLADEMEGAEAKYGPFASSHEIYAVLLEEVEEFWEGVKRDNPNPYELVQVAAVALRGALQLAAQARGEEP